MSGRLRPYTAYADRKYLQAEGPAHIVAWGEERALCGTFATAEKWYGTGDWHETEHAAWLSLCTACHAAANPIGLSDEDPAVDAWRQTLTAKN